MKKTAVVITLGLILIVAGYLAYEKWFVFETRGLWDNVPENAVMVLESGSTVDSWNELVKSSMWQSLSKLESFREIKNNLEFLDSLSGKTGGMAKILQQNSLISLHVTEKNSFDFLYYLDLSTSTNQTIATRVLRHFKSQPEVKYSERLYQGFNLSELNGLQRSFTYVIDKNIFIGSFTSFLVEDVVRVINDGYTHNFKKTHASLFDLPKLSNDDGNLYVNLNTLPLWFGSFLDAGNRESIKPLQSFSNSAFFDADLSDNKILLNGFTAAGHNNNYLDCFKNQHPVPSNVKYYVPNRTSVYYQIGLSDPVKWNEELIKYWSYQAPGYLTKRTKFEQEYNIQMSDIFQWVGSGVALIELERSSRGETEKLIFVDCSDPTEALNQFNRFSESLAQAQGDSVYRETFSTYQIRELKVEEFPMYAFGPFFSGYEECYFTLIENYMVMANSMLTLKSLIEDMEGENTWGRSVGFNRFLESTLEESNISVIFNTRRYWENLQNDLDPKWNQFANKNATALKNFHLGSVQFSRLDENFYTSVALQHEDRPVSTDPYAYEVISQATLENKIITKPYVVKSHVSNGLEVVLQDSSYQFMLIGENGQIQWQDSLGQPIVSDVEQVDFYKNGKLQYFFATKNALHIIDRLGNYIEGYPVEINANLQFASVVDYDKSKNYRFLLGDERGNLYLYNKEGVNLEGWDPRVLTGRLASKPFHLRVRGRDCIVAIQQDGIINIMNRRGEMMPGFPLKLDSRVNTSPFVEIGSDFDKTIFNVISREGRLIRFNLSGTVISTEQLYKASTETSFKLIPDALGKNFVIARQDLTRLVLLSSDKRELLSKDYLSSEDLLVQFYDLNTDHKIYAITDRVQGFTYLYDKEGKLVSSRPLESEQEIGLLYFESNRKYRVYSVWGNTFKILTF